MRSRELKGYVLDERFIRDCNLIEKEEEIGHLQ